MPFATPLPSGILASGVKSNCTGGTTETIGALATGALATGGRATGKLTAGASGGALVSGAFEATTLTLASLEPFLAFGFALAWKKTEKLVTENEAFVLACHEGYDIIARMELDLLHPYDFAIKKGCTELARNGKMLRKMGAKLIYTKLHLTWTESFYFQEKLYMSYKHGPTCASQNDGRGSAQTI